MLAQDIPCGPKNEKNRQKYFVSKCVTWVLVYHSNDDDESQPPGLTVNVMCLCESLGEVFSEKLSGIHNVTCLDIRTKSEHILLTGGLSQYHLIRKHLSLIPLSLTLNTWGPKRHLVLLHQCGRRRLRTDLNFQQSDWILTFSKSLLIPFPSLDADLFVLNLNPMWESFLNLS